jgi:hypothetical protein
MKRPLYANAANPFLLWSSLAVKTLEMSTAAAQVIALRTGRMAAHGANPNAADRREMVRMGAEKVDAFSRAGQALATGTLPLMAGMAGQAMRSGMDVFQVELTEALMRSAPGTTQGANAGARLAHRALAPVHAKATANAKRLSRKR